MQQQPTVTHDGVEYVIIYDGSGRPHLVPLPTSPTTTEASRIHKDSFPKFDGSYDKFPSWLTQVDATLESSRWKNILQDISTTPQNATRSQALRVALLNCLTKDPLHLFQNDPTYQGKGIEMRQRLNTKYQPTGVEALFDILTHFFSSSNHLPNPRHHLLQECEFYLLERKLLDR